jgi:uncharacterized protein YbbC (DUF1343 family)
MLKLKTVSGVLMLAFILVMPFVSNAKNEGVKVSPGVEMLFSENKYLDLIKGQKVGLITNPTGIDGNFNTTIDLLADYSGCDLIALFGPKHGIRGDFFGGAKVADSVDKKSGAKIYSLYGSGRRAPSKEVLKTLDVLIYDIQDIGIRPYTYINTMINCMKAAKKAGVTYIVLDRPDPMGGNNIDGPVLDMNFKSGIGIWKIPYTYGLTPGELAIMYNTEENLGADLHVVKMKGWKRGMLYNETGLPWVPPSTHIARWTTSFYCAITGGFGELHTINEGVGYTLPFEVAAAPFIDGTSLSSELNSRGLPGVFFRPISYKVLYYKFKDKHCSGVHIYITDPLRIRPFFTGINILDAINRMYPEEKVLEAGKRLGMFNKAMGTDEILKMLNEKKSPGEIEESYQEGLDKYLKMRKKYLLYK